MALPRVIVVEDDPALRGFVGAALHGDDIGLVLCCDIAQAVVALQSEPQACLVLTDLNLHRESGLTLIERLADDPRLRRSARVAVFSANIDAAKRQHLAQLGV